MPTYKMPLALREHARCVNLTILPELSSPVVIRRRTLSAPLRFPLLGKDPNTRSLSEYLVRHQHYKG